MLLSEAKGCFWKGLGWCLIKRASTAGGTRELQGESRLTLDLPPLPWVRNQESTTSWNLCKKKFILEEDLNIDMQVQHE